MTDPKERSDMNVVFSFVYIDQEKWQEKKPVASFSINVK